jgi:hypothetical protein
MYLLNKIPVLISGIILSGSSNQLCSKGKAKSSTILFNIDQYHKVLFCFEFKLNLIIIGLKEFVIP